jgi:LAO/AO transport system kinase
MADMILVNKSDGVLAGPAKIAQVISISVILSHLSNINSFQMEYISALKFVQSNSQLWKPEVLRVSSAEKNGISEAWERMKAFYRIMQSSSELDHRRGVQRRKWMWKIVSDEIMSQVKGHASVKKIVPDLEQKVTDGAITSGHAAERILETFREHSMK